jgi:hypothetical protein
MSITQIRPTDEKRTAPVATGHPWRRLTLLSALLALSIGYNVYLLLTAPASNTPQIPLFVTAWLFAFLPYLAACGVVLVMKPQTGRLRWVELGLLLVGALALRLIVLPVPPNLSHDSWRYLWDARVTLFGYSPYVYPPANPLFISLQDFLYNNSRFRDVPTIYPPGAQGIFLLSYLMAPGNLVVLKGIFMGFEMVTCGALAFLLWRKGLDMSRCIIYAWCPLPIIEFAIQGHLDVTTITFTVLALICAGSQWRGSRVVTGFLIAMATLTKIYPILFLLVVIRRRDWALLVTCFATIILAYVPYLILGRGQAFGFFSTYASQDHGFMQWVIIRIGGLFALNHSIVSLIIYAFDLALVGGMSIAILRWRWQERISMETSVLLLIGVIFAVSSNLLPWYTAAFLPWIALQIGPLWTKQGGFNEVSLAIIATWYYVCSNVISYYMSQNLYYSVVNGVTLLLVALALGMRMRKNRLARRNEPGDHERGSVIGTVRLMFGRHGRGKA